MFNMKDFNIKFSNHIQVKSNRIEIDLNNPTGNIFQIDDIDYIPYYLNNLKPGNRGNNSFVLKLVAAQNMDEDEGDFYPKIPDTIIKICKFSKGRFNEHTNSQKFGREIKALVECGDLGMPNLMKIHHYGLVNIGSGNYKNDYRYYTMDYAQDDLTTFLVKNNLDLVERLQLCIDISNSLKQ